MTSRKRLARKVAARWAIKQALGDWQPTIPPEALEYFNRVAYVPDTEPLIALEDAQASVGVMIPKILRTLGQHQGDHYAMNASESRGRIFYFFSPPQPVDAFNLTLYIKNGRAVLVFGYTPYKLDGHLDIANMKQKREESDPGMAGLAVMRALRALLTEI